MFSVFLDELAFCSEELNRIITKQRSEIQNMEDIIRTLNSLSGMNDVIGTLRKEKQTMELQQQKLYNMLQSLQKIRLCYLTTEKKVSENGDGGTYFKVYSYGPVEMSWHGQNDKKFPYIFIE